MTLNSLTKSKTNVLKICNYLVLKILFDNKNQLFLLLSCKLLYTLNFIFYICKPLITCRLHNFIDLAVTGARSHLVSRQRNVELIPIAVKVNKALMVIIVKQNLSNFVSNLRN